MLVHGLLRGTFTVDAIKRSVGRDGQSGIILMPRQYQHSIQRMADLCVIWKKKVCRCGTRRGDEESPQYRNWCIRLCRQALVPLSSSCNNNVSRQLSQWNYTLSAGRKGIFLPNHWKFSLQCRVPQDPSNGQGELLWLLEEGRWPAVSIRTSFAKGPDSILRPDTGHQCATTIFIGVGGWGGTDLEDIQNMCFILKIKL